MRNYIILNGTNSNTIAGLLIQELAPISKPLMRTEIEEIDGRDGDIITPLGFSAYDKQITIGLYGTYDINAIIAFFNSEGTVTFSNEPDKYYNYQIYDQIDFERLVRFKTATVTLHCQPFKFATTGESQTLSGGDPISAEGTNLVLEGSGLAPFSQFDLKGNTEQQTYTGKNMLNVNFTSGVSGGITITNNGDGTITARGTSTGNVAMGISPTSVNNLVLQSGKTYTQRVEVISGNLNLRLVPSFKNSGGTITYNYFVNNQSKTTTDTMTCNAYNLYESTTGLPVGSSVNFTIRVWLEEGSDLSSPYEPYVGGTASPNPDYPQAVKVVTGENVVKIHGKNLFDYTGYNSSMDGLTTILNADGTFTITGVPTRDYGRIVPSFDITQLLEDGATYTISQPEANGQVYMQVTVRNALTGIDSYIYTQNYASRTFTVDKTTNTYRISAQTGTMSNWGTSSRTITTSFQLEKGQASDFVPYQGQSYPISLGTLELCKIGTYQDYIYKSGDKWYKHKEVGKVILNGSETWTTQTNTPGYKMYRLTLSGVASNTASAVANLRTDSFRPASSDEVYTSKSGYKVSQLTTAGYVRFFTGDQTDKLAEFKTWLGNNTPALYYALATPVDEEITNAALIEQLNDIADQAHAYKGTTHVVSAYIDGNVPHIIAATVVGSADGTITNAGNIYSKPKLTVYGSGDIGIYLNGVQMFQIALGSDGYITIDTNLMEAYKDNLQTLKNRQVTGDYSNFKLPVGQSTISFSGIVTSCVVENFSRWL